MIEGKSRATEAEICERENWKRMEKSRSCSRITGSDDDGRVANVDKCVISLCQDGKTTGKEKLIEGNSAILLLVNNTFPLGFNI